MIIKGDIDGDGRITPIDALCIVYINELTEEEKKQFPAADVNGDGKINTSDILRIQLHFDKGTLIDEVIE